MQVILRGVSCFEHPSLDVFDGLLRDGIHRITNSNLSDTQWLQASLPVRDGGLGIRRVASLALPAYLASAAGSRLLQSQILSSCSIYIDGDSFEPALFKRWSEYSSIAPPLGDQPIVCKQSFWDRPGIVMDIQSIRDQAKDEYNRARINAVSAPHSGDWLHARPITSCGLRLDDEAVRVAVGMRLGVNLCEPHKCPCGTLVDARGTHGLSCKQVAGRMARHHWINDLVWRALSRANIPSCKEPNGLSRSDGRRPDGMTLIPWKSGKALLWDVTIVNSVASSYLSASSSSVGSIAEMAAEKKEAKYADLSQNYLFQPLAFEALGAINASAIAFFYDLGKRLSAVSGDTREIEFLFQRLSVALQRFNSVTFQETFSVSAEVYDE